MPKLQFLGATGTVTGSKYLLSTEGRNFLIDCGLFQGLKELVDRNWLPPSYSPKEIEAVFITHAHLDHTGYLPKLVQLGFKGKIYCTPSTLEMLHIMLLDSAHLQEEDKVFHNHKRCCNTHQPLYTVQDAVRAIHQLEKVDFGKTLQFGNVTVEFVPAGHILGSAFVGVNVVEQGKTTNILFTGDMGRYHAPILKDPTTIPEAEYVLLESTYGNREHSPQTGEEALLPPIQECIKRSGCLLMPAFTVGRTQEILYGIRNLLAQKKIPPIPVYVDSPMAIDMTHLYEIHHDEHDLDMEGIERQGGSPFHFPSLKYVRMVEESKELNDQKGPMIIISANGMATGGRIMHHLLHRLPDPSTILLFVGYQAEGTNGRALLEGAKNVHIFHQDVPVKATIMQADNFSAHGDYHEIVQWLSGFQKAPDTIFLVHGEPDARVGLKGHILEKFPSWKIELPNELDVVNL